MNVKGIQIRDVRVVDFQPENNAMAFAIEIAVETPTDLMTFPAKMEAAEKMNRAFKYLVDEGFIQDPLCNIGSWQIAVFANLKQKD